MSEIKVNNIQSLSGTNGPVVSGITTMASSGAMSLPRGNTAYRGGRGRGVFAGGYAAPNAQQNVIEYITIATLGNSNDFGDLTVARRDPAGCASATRGLFFVGGWPGNTKVIDYVEVASTGNAFDFGEITLGFGSGNDGLFQCAAVSNSTRGICAGGIDNPAPIVTTNIQYVNIANKGNTSLFGDLTVARFAVQGAGSPTRGIFSGGATPDRVNTIDYITITTLGDALDFGDLNSPGKRNVMSCSNSTRAVLGGGYDTGSNFLNTIEYVTIASTGDTIDFGDLSETKSRGAATASQTRGVFFGGERASPAVETDTIEYVTISTLGNAVDFGNIRTGTRRDAAGLSDSHGGIG